MHRRTSSWSLVRELKNHKKKSPLLSPEVDSIFQQIPFTNALLEFTNNQNLVNSSGNNSLNVEQQAYVFPTMTTNGHVANFSSFPDSLEQSPTTEMIPQKTKRSASSANALANPNSILLAEEELKKKSTTQDETALQKRNDRRFFHEKSRSLQPHPQFPKNIILEEDEEYNSIIPKASKKSSQNAQEQRPESVTANQIDLMQTLMNKKEHIQNIQSHVVNHLHPQQIFHPQSKDVGFDYDYVMSEEQYQLLQHQHQLASNLLLQQQQSAIDAVDDEDEKKLIKLIAEAANAKPPRDPIVLFWFGFFLIVWSFFTFFFVGFSMLSKLMFSGALKESASQNSTIFSKHEWWLMWFVEDWYYSLLYPLMSVVFVLFAYMNWFGMKLFRHSRTAIINEE